MMGGSHRGDVGKRVRTEIELDHRVQVYTSNLIRPAFGCVIILMTVAVCIRRQHASVH
jgi:hypothetical protein